MKSNLCLKIRGEPWVSYPFEMRFPLHFASIYPFRGRGFVSRLLFVMNRIRFDRFVLSHGNPPLPYPYEEVAWFWPSASRSIGRYYGYKVENGRIVEYIKVAVSDKEKAALKREVANVSEIMAARPRGFRIPAVRGVVEIDGCLVSRFDPLPPDAKALPDKPAWLEKVELARKEIASLGLSHGDFLSHNIKVAGDALWIIDWEEMMHDAPVLLDEISFNTAFMYFNRKKSIGEVCNWLSSTYLLNEESRQEAITALRSMASRNVGLGGKILEHLNMG